MGAEQWEGNKVGKNLLWETCRSLAYKFPSLRTFVSDGKQFSLIPTWERKSPCSPGRWISVMTLLQSQVEWVLSVALWYLPFCLKTFVIFWIQNELTFNVVVYCILILCCYSSRADITFLTIGTLLNYIWAVDFYLWTARLRMCWKRYTSTDIIDLWCRGLPSHQLSAPRFSGSVLLSQSYAPIT